MKKAEQIGGIWLFISIVCFLVSNFMWGILSDEKVTKIYFISFYNVAMVSGLLLMMTSRKDIVHFAGTGMFCIFSWMISLEFLGNPVDWSDWNIGTFLIDGFCSIFISLKLKKYKEDAVG